MWLTYHWQEKETTQSKLLSEMPRKYTDVVFETALKDYGEVSAHPSFGTITALSTHIAAWFPYGERRIFKSLIPDLPGTRVILLGTFWELISLIHRSPMLP